jgi:UDP:flavonoid glycosyltransferase YjiC (YdhE family)
LANILYIWEFGGGLGHLVPAVSLANAYRARGHDVGFVVRDIAAAGVVIPADAFPVYQAPVWQPAASAVVQRPISYAEILLNHGLGDSTRLASMTRAWIRLLQLLKPDLLVLDFSPTAMLAAQIAGIRHCSFGAGFFLPPHLSPVPAFRPSANHEQLCRSEGLVLAAINQVRDQLGAAPLACFADFFASVPELLATWPELDHYPQRRGARYWGPVLLRVGGKTPDWRADATKRVFVYLFGHDARLEAVLHAVAASGADALIYCPGIPSQLLQRFSSERMKFSTTLYAVDRVLAQADALICHGNFGTVCEGLLAGTPMLCLPVHMEHHISATQLVDLGVAIVPPSDASVANLTAAIHDLLHQPRYREAAGRIALKYKDHDVAAQLAQLVEASTAGL